MDSLGAIDPGPFLAKAAMERNRRIFNSGDPKARQTIFLEELLRNIFLKPFLTQPSVIFSEDDEDSEFYNQSTGGEIYNMMIRDLLAKELAENKSFGFNKEIIKKIENNKGAKE